MHSFNTVFRVDASGERFALRVGDSCRIHARGVEDVESEWLDELARAGFPVARNVRCADGAAWVEHEHVSVPGPRVCTLFTWLDGSPLLERVTPVRMRRAGELLARLHEHAASFEAPSLGSPSLESPSLGSPSFESPSLESPSSESQSLKSPLAPATLSDRIRAQRAVYFHEENRLQTFESEHGSLFVEAIDRVQRQIDELWSQPPHSPHLLHGDFGPHNVLVNRGRYQPIDFQDLQFGFDVQDLGITLADLGRSLPESVQLFIDGYSTVRVLPEISPERQALFAAARSLNILNLALVAPGSGITRSFDRHATRVATWMS